MRRYIETKGEIELQNEEFIVPMITIEATKSLKYSVRNVVTRTWLPNTFLVYRNFPL